MTILLVDDTPDVIELVRYYTRRLQPPMDVISVCTCDEALSMFTKMRGQIGCILMDQGLPGQDGISCVKELRGMEFEGPIIILTGHLDGQVVSKAFQSGADDFVLKDAMAMELSTAIELAIHRRVELAQIRQAYAARLAEMHDVYDALDQTVANVRKYLLDIDDSLKS
jgi:two-component system, OmpR family, response regulator